MLLIHLIFNDSKNYSLINFVFEINYFKVSQYHIRRIHQACSSSGTMSIPSLALLHLHDSAKPTFVIEVRILARSCLYLSLQSIWVYQCHSLHWSHRK